MLHAPTFNPKSTLGQLLLIILGIGAIYAPVPGALQLGRVLIEVARRGTEHLINRDNRLARSLPVVRLVALCVSSPLTQILAGPRNPYLGHHPLDRLGEDSRTCGGLPRHPLRHVPPAPDFRRLGAAQAAQLVPPGPVVGVHRERGEEANGDGVFPCVNARPRPHTCGAIR